jgi:hypothetical protein
VDNVSSDSIFAKEIGRDASGSIPEDSSERFCVGFAIIEQRARLTRKSVLDVLFGPPLPDGEHCMRK